MPFTLKDAREMVGSSTDWNDGLKASTKKWEQLASGDTETYEYSALCGFCFVKDNRGCYCVDCPADYICERMNVDYSSPDEVLAMLLELKCPDDPNLKERR